VLSTIIAVKMVFRRTFGVNPVLESPEPNSGMDKVVPAHTVLAD
jgi:hypothetical protein